MRPASQGSADLGVTVELTEAEIATLIAGQPVTRFVEAVPAERLYQDLEVVIYPPKPRPEE